ncbi:hypothetical protein [Pedobacter sp. WC2423]|uniref:hypothetical protein n=1 Tax=Pedobacter sp. WC2423 TaxID=3234142 RepID=UPI0034651842
MNETEFLDYCKSQLTGPIKDEDIITMLTAWGSIKYSQGYTNAQSEKEDIE